MSVEELCMGAGRDEGVLQHRDARCLGSVTTRRQGSQYADPREAGESGGGQD